MSRVCPLLVALALAGCSAPALKNFSSGPDNWTTSDASTTDTSTSDTSTTTSSIETSTDGEAGTGGEAGSDPGSTGSTSTAGSSTTSTGSSSSGASTGEPAFCGDGVVAGDEECDDGDLDFEDACNGTCKRERVVFVTSLQFQPDAIGGLHLADGICRQLAQKADLPNFAGYTAWLSDSTTDAIERVFRGEGRYVRPDGLVVAKSLKALLEGPLLAPIEIDEHGELAIGSAWTGTRPDGTGVPGSTHCEDWTTADFFDKSGWYGNLPATDTRWTLETDPQVAPSSCVDEFHLYCFEGA